MSLSSILSNPNYRDLKDVLREYFPTPKFELESDIIAPPLSQNYGIVGAAFDYLLRFYFKRRAFNRASTKLKPIPNWLAESAFHSIEHKFPENNRRFKFNNKQLNRNEFMNTVKDSLSKAKLEYQKYNESGKFHNGILKYSILLAQLDLIIRASFLDPKLGVIDSADVDDLRALTGLIEDKTFDFNSILLNPFFGKGSKLVNGADADIIIDDLLIEIKTTKNLKLDRSHFNQLICYYVLSLIGEADGMFSYPSSPQKMSKKEIKRIGIYFARHGLLWTIPLDEIASKKKFNEFKDWFVNYIQNEVYPNNDC